MPTTAADYIAAFGRLGSGFGSWNEERKLKNVLSQFNGDYNAAAQELMRMGKVDEATRLYTAGQLAQYRDIQGQVALGKAESAEDQLLKAWLPYAMPGPSRIGPPDTAADAAEEAEAAGVPGTAYAQASGYPSNMPDSVAKKVLPTDEYSRRDSAGRLAADRDDYAAKRDIFGKRAEAVMQDLFNKLEGYDDSSVANALGPLQGVDQEGWRATLQNIPQMYGEAKNKYWSGGDNSTYEVRGTIKGSINALTNAIKPFVRIKGDVWSDRDQALLTSILGGLQESQSRPELYRRFNDAIDRINAAWGFNINFRAPETNPDARANNSAVEEPKTAERYTNPTEEVPGPTTGGMSGVNENTMVGGVNIGRTTNQPPTPPAKAINALRAFANNPRYREQAKAEWEAIYGPGSFDHYTQKYR